MRNTAHPEREKKTSGETFYSGVPEYQNLPSLPSENPAFRPSDVPSSRLSETEVILPPLVEIKAFEPPRIVWKFWNPCGCWCCPVCNLRVCLIGIAVFTIAFFCYGVSYHALHLPTNCKHGHCGDLGKQFCGLYRKDKDKIATTSLVLLVGFIGDKVSEFIAAILILIACFTKYEGFAIAGGISYWIESIFSAIELWAYYEYLRKWPHLMISRVNSAETPKEYDGRIERIKYVFLFISMALVILPIYFGICCILFRLQIKLGVSNAPHKFCSCTEDPEDALVDEVIDPPNLPLDSTQPANRSFIISIPQTNHPPAHGGHQDTKSPLPVKINSPPRTSDSH